MQYIMSKNNDVDINLTEEINRICKNEGYGKIIDPHKMSQNGSLVLKFRNNGKDDSIYVFTKKDQYSKAVKLQGNNAVWNSYLYALTYDYADNGKKIIKELYNSSDFSAEGAPSGVVCNEIKTSSAEGFLYEVKCDEESYLVAKGLYVKNGRDGSCKAVVKNNQTNISKENINAMVAQNVSKPVVIEADNVSFEFSTGSMKMVDGIESWDFGSSQKSSYNAAGKLPAGVTASNFVYYINYNHSGKLPGTAKITISLGSSYAGMELYYSLLSNDGSITLVQKVTANAQGRITVTQDHCSTYIVTKEKITAASVSTKPTDSTDTKTPDIETADTKESETAEEGSNETKTEDSNIESTNSSPEKGTLPKNKETDSDTIEKGSRLGVVWMVVIIILAVIAAGFGAYFILKKNGKLIVLKEKLKTIFKK